MRSSPLLLKSKIVVRYSYIFSFLFNIEHRLTKEDLRSSPLLLKSKIVNQYSYIISLLFNIEHRLTKEDLQSSPLLLKSKIVNQYSYIFLSSLILNTDQRIRSVWIICEVSRHHHNQSSIFRIWPILSCLVLR